MDAGDSEEKIVTSDLGNRLYSSVLVDLEQRAALGAFEAMAAPLIL
jgi:hypothetical protein